MKKLAAFPSTFDLLALLKYKELLVDYEFISVCSFKEDPLLKEVSMKYPDLNVTADALEALELCETLLLLDNENGAIFDKYKFILEEAYRDAKEIIASDDLMGKISEERPYISLNKELPQITGYEKSVLKDISVPVIGICGMGKNCSKFETLLAVLREVRKKEYQVLLLSPNLLITLLGGYTLPKYLYDDSISLERKILRFNEDLYQYLMGQEYDLILIELPGGVMPLLGNEKNHFSEIPMVISNALTIDVAILNVYMPFDKNKTQYENWIEYCDYKFKMPIEEIFVSRQKAEYDREREKMEYYFLDKEDYVCLFEKYAVDSIVNLDDGVQVENAINRIIGILENNVEFI